MTRTTAKRIATSDLRRSSAVLEMNISQNIFLEPTGYQIHRLRWIAGNADSNCGSGLPLSSSVVCDLCQVRNA